jgi:hypothetical protein
MREKAGVRRRLRGDGATEGRGSREWYRTLIGSSANVPRSYTKGHGAHPSTGSGARLRLLYRSRGRPSAAAQKSGLSAVGTSEFLL